MRGVANPLSRKARVSSNLTSSAFASLKSRFTSGRKRASPFSAWLRRDKVRYHLDETLVKSRILLFMWYVYCFLCSDGKTYIGCTNDLKDRKSRHDNGQVPATKDRLPVKLTSYFAFTNKYTAFNFEKYLKSGSGRAFIVKHELFNF